MRSLTDSLELFFTSWCLLSLLAMMGLPVFLFVCFELWADLAP